MKVPQQRPAPLEGVMFIRDRWPAVALTSARYSETGEGALRSMPPSTLPRAHERQSTSEQPHGQPELGAEIVHGVAKRIEVGNHHVGNDPLTLKTVFAIAPTDQRGLCQQIVDQWL